MKIPLYDNYDLSEYGVVTNTNTGKRVASFKNQKGYHRIALCREGTTKTLTLHRLVLTVFDKPCPEGHVAHHKDRNRDNNHISNLEWILKSDHFYHPTHIRTPLLGSSCPNAKLTEEQVAIIKRNHTNGASIKSLAELFGVSTRAIGFIVPGVTWRHV